MYLDEIGEMGAYVDDEDAARVLRAVVVDQKNTSRRIAELILDRLGTIRVAPYPMEFTDKNDLSLDFLVREALEGSKADVDKIQQVLFALPTNDAAARELAQEALGAAKAHVEELEALATRQAA
jgi:hypothetical protein